jgi:hypothetical protein
MIKRIQYIDYSEGIYPGMVISNNLFTQAPVKIRVYQLSSANPSVLYFKADYHETIPAYGIWRPDPSAMFSQGKRYTVFVYGDVEVELATVIMSGSDVVGFGYSPPGADCLTFEESLVDHATDKTYIGASPYYYFMGDCAYIRKHVKNIVEILAMEICYGFRDRIDRCLCFYDCVPEDESYCPGHLGAHGGDDAADFDVGYYTFETNNTQAIGRTEIWEDESDPESNLLTDVFDIERNAWFFRKLKLCFPNVKIKVDSRIKTVLIAQYSDLTWLSGTAPRQNNHHLHAHIGLEGVLGELAVDWSVVL